MYRAGTRFNVRGLDNEGQVANFVETEEILQYDGNTCSFVQVDMLLAVIIILFHYTPDK